MAQFRRSVRIESPAQEVFAWHARPGAFERLNPPWAPARVLKRTGGIENGAEVHLEMPVGPARVGWVARHVDYEEGRQFRDVQVSGPFARWEHTHRMEPDGPRASRLDDCIEYELPFRPFGQIFGGSAIERSLDRVFGYRHRTTVNDLRAHAAHRGRSLSVLVTGSHGLVGGALVPFLTTGGHRVISLSRSGAGDASSELRWSPEAGVLDGGPLEAMDAVVHLAGENIASGRWTQDKKRRIRESRIRGTRLLCDALASLDRPPKVLVCASAIGIYGDRGAEVLDESSPQGDGFLADVCTGWEAASRLAAEAGIRVVNLRFGVILSPLGGALRRLITPFQLGVGGRVGSGKQFVSWIALDDAIGGILHSITSDRLSGPVNAVAPEPVTNAELTTALARVLRRPAILPMPTGMVRLAFGEMADETLLASARVDPGELKRASYRFRHPQIDGALRHLLGR